MNTRLMLAALACAAPFVVAASQPQTIVPLRGVYDQKPARTVQYAAWIPAGTYSAIVLNSSGDERRWAVSLMTKTTNVPIVVPPRDNIIIEFKDGWTLAIDDEARLVSNLVPFDDSALYNKFGEQPNYVLSAWGITAKGPVQFTYREIKP